MKFTDDDEVRARRSLPTLTPAPPLQATTYTIYSKGLSYTGTGKSKGYQVLAMEDDDDMDDADAQPYLINQTLIDLIRVTTQDESIKLVEPEVGED